MSGKTGNQIDWAAFLRTPALSYLLLTLLANGSGWGSVPGRRSVGRTPFAGTR
jgi:hypothetical protein